MVRTAGCPEPSRFSFLPGNSGNKPSKKASLFTTIWYNQDAFNSSGTDHPWPPNRLLGAVRSAVLTVALWACGFGRSSLCARVSGRSHLLLTPRRMSSGWVSSARSVPSSSDHPGTSNHTISITDSVGHLEGGLCSGTALPLDIVSCFNSDDFLS